MIPQTSAQAYQSNSLKAEINPFALFDPSEGSGGSSWYAPNGGTWTATQITDFNEMLRPYLITYTTYDELVLIQSNRLVDSTLQICKGIIESNGIEFSKNIVISYIKNTKGEELLNKLSPYLRNMALFYNFCVAAINYSEALVIDKATQNKTGLAFSTGTTKLGQYYQSVDTWTGNIVYNPPGSLGIFAHNF